MLLEEPVTDCLYSTCSTSCERQKKRSLFPFSFLILLLFFWLLFINYLKKFWVSVSCANCRDFMFRSKIIAKDCVRSAPIRSFFWSIFSRIQSEYVKTRTREKHFSRSELVTTSAQTIILALFTINDCFFSLYFSVH